MDMEKARARGRRWYHKHKHKLIVNEEVAKAAKKRYYEKNREAVIARTQEWRRANPEKTRENGRLQRQRRRALMKSAEGTFSLDDIKVIFDNQLGKCYYCKLPLERYEIDHKTPLKRGGSNWPSNLCCACVTCNRRKHTKTEQEFGYGN